MASLDLSVGTDTWLDMYDVTPFVVGLPVIIQNKGSGFLSIIISDIAPNNEDTGGIIIDPYHGGANHTRELSPSVGSRIYLKAQGTGCKVSVQRLDEFVGSEPIPAGAFTGNRAMTVQNYIESNVKNGVQYESSRYLLNVPGNSNVDSIFITGSKPVILKVRALNYSGVGVIGQLFRSSVYTGGTPAQDQIRNLNDITPVPTTIQLISAPTITTLGATPFAFDYLFGSAQPQAQGGNSDLGQERIFRANTAYHFRIVSLDPNVQNISAYISWFEGNPDLPLPAGF